MKKQIAYLLLTLLFLSCRAEIKHPCFASSNLEFRAQLKSSYYQFLRANNFETTIDFLQTYASEGIGPTEKLNFDKQDESLAERLKDAKFFEFAYEKINYEDHWDELPDEQKQRMIEKAKMNNPNAYRFNPDSDFVKCMTELAKKDSVAYHYSKLILTYENPSPALLSNGLLNMSKKYEENIGIIDWITIVNYYYPLLNSEFEK